MRGHKKWVIDISGDLKYNVKDADYGGSANASGRGALAAKTKVQMLEREFGNKSVLVLKEECKKRGLAHAGITKTHLCGSDCSELLVGPEPLGDPG